MSFKELATGFVVGAVTVFLGPTLLSWAGVSLPSFMPAAAMEGEYVGYEGDYYGYEGEDYFSQAAKRAMRSASVRSRARAMGIRRGYEGEYLGDAAKMVGRTISISPRAAGRAVASHTGNTIGYGGDLRRAPRGAFQQLSHPALTGSVSRLNRF